MFRKIRQLFVDAELKKVADDIDRETDKLQDLVGKHELLVARFDRLQSRYGMRAARAARSVEEGLSQEEIELVERLRRSETGSVDDPFADVLPH